AFASRTRAEQFSRRIDRRHRFAVDDLGFDRFDGAAWFAHVAAFDFNTFQTEFRVRLALLVFSLFVCRDARFRRHIPREAGALERRSRKHAQTAAPVALEPHEPVLLTRANEIDQSAETVSALVEPAIRGAKQLLHVTQ